MCRTSEGAGLLRCRGLALLLVVVPVNLHLAREARAEIVMAQPRTGALTESNFERAKASSADANAAFEKGDIDAAMSHAAAAYQVYPNASTAMLLATVYDHAKNPRKAFEWYLRARNHEPTEVLVGKIDQALTEVGTKVKLGVVHVRTRPEAATVHVDGETLTAGRFFGLSFGSQS